MKLSVLAKDIGSPLMHPAAYAIGENHSKLEKLLGIKIAKSFEQYRNRDLRFLFTEKAFLREEKRTAQLLQSKAFFNKVEKNSLHSINNLLAEAMKAGKNPERLSNKQIATQFNKLFNSWIEMNFWGHVVNLSDFHFNVLSDKLINALEEIKKEKNIKLSVGKTFSKLIVMKKKTEIQKQDINFFKLLSMIQKNQESIDLFKSGLNEIQSKLKHFPKIEKAIKSHTKKYDWMQYHYDSQIILDENHFIELFSGNVKKGLKGEKKLREFREHDKKSLSERKKLIKELELDKEFLYWLEVAQSFMYLKALRKEVSFQSNRLAHPLICETSKRLSISPTQLRHLTIEELIEALEKNKVNVNLLNERIKHCIVSAEKDRLVIISGDKAEKFSKKIKGTVLKRINEIYGTVAYPGFTQGIIKIIEKPEDMAKMNKKDILVSSATNPNLLPAIRKAAAIITDEGGITCHAAIVSRELKIPCVIGTKIATEVLKDGSLVEVNATHGKIKILKK
ncbi:MAG: PEP-utilizing enzyme [archaeon]